MSVTGTGAQTPGTTTYTLNAFGQTASASIGGSYPATVAYAYDASGEGIARDRTGSGAVHDDWMRFGGVEMGHATNGVQQKKP